MILVLQTADATTRIWLLEPAGTVGEPALVWESGRGLADGLLGRIVATVRGADRELVDLTGVVVFSGPGSFTSLRIGHAVANALADSLGIAVVGVPGDDWIEAGRAGLVTTPRGRSALPYYGADAHISQPRA